MATPLACNLRLSDVHAMADTVGREFKELTDKFGASCVMGLVPPVVDALERLEVYVESYQKMQTRLCELLMENDTVAYEREQRAKLTVENEVSERRGWRKQGGEVTHGLLSECGAVTMCYVSEPCMR